MGKIYPLDQKPSCYEATLKLIEKSFQYQGAHSFEIDFAPLVDKRNHSNCFILVDENENVLAHVGVKEKFISLNGKKYSITLLGGIAVDESRRGEGLFQELFQDVLAEKRSDTTLFLLWSDLEKLYNKFGFHLCGTQVELTKKRIESTFLKTKFAMLTLEEKNQIHELFQESFFKFFITPERSADDWKLIELITSAELYVRKSGTNITDYYFMNKGQDLPDIIYEYGTKGEMADLINEISSYGKVWLGKELEENESVQYQFFMSPGDLRLFSEFILDFTKGKFAIRNINLMKQEVFFDFNDETLSLELPEFLRGVFGPSPFEELEIMPLFISGLDSI